MIENVIIIIICLSLITGIIGTVYVMINSHKIDKEIKKKEKEQEEYYGIFKY